MMFSTAPKAHANGRNEVQIKAGRAKLTPGPKEGFWKVEPEVVRGLLKVRKTDDGYAHLQWKNLSSNVIEDDLILLTGDAIFMNVTECTDGKVYMVKFRSTQERRVFWIQDGTPNSDKDLVKKVNALISNDTSDLFSSIQRSQRAGASGSPPRTPVALDSLWTPQNPTDRSRRVLGLDRYNAEDLRQMLAQITSRHNPFENLLGLSEDLSNGSAQNRAQNPLKSENSETSTSGHDVCDFNEVFKDPKVLEAIKKNKDRFMDKTIEYQEGSDQKVLLTEEVETTTRRPEFQNAVRSITYAINSGQIGSVLQQFGLPENVVNASNSGDALELANALTAAELGYADREIKQESRTDGANSNDHMETE
ncbi:unnamed protein product, partial [Mesorhabditis belari]|uniref:Uncharacterized protein n=1 Tax=Mesorhabditis belari TaxID=2138241 RepID=A0AAF3FKW6_9BILA